MSFGVYGPGQGWALDARGITGNSSSAGAVIPGGINTLVHLGIVVDGKNNQVYGTYDYGSGVQVTPAFSVTPAQIAELNTVQIEIDRRGGAGQTGAAYDNISVNTFASAVPEPSTLLSLGSMLVSGGAFLLRRSRKR